MQPRASQKRSKNSTQTSAGSGANVGTRSWRMALKINLDTITGRVSMILKPLMMASLFALALIAQFIVSSPWRLYIFTVISGVLLAMGLSKIRKIVSPKKFDWSKEIVLITGGGSGLGALLALTLAQTERMKGVQVVILTLFAPTYDERIDGLHTYLCDVSKYDQVVLVAERVKKEVGAPTILINNAGQVQGKLLLDLSEEDIQNTFNVNTLAHFWTLKAFLPDMLARRRGHIVNISSVLGLCGAAQMTDYCASKAALVSLHASLRAELDFRYLVPEIRTTLVLPGLILTNMFQCLSLPTNALFRFIAPPVAPETVVSRIVKAIEIDTSSSTMIRLPFYTHSARVLADGVGLAPDILKSWAGWFTGAHVAMKNYGPHPDAAQRLVQSRSHSK